MHRITLLTLILVVLSGFAAAQLAPGDYVAPLGTGNAVVGITPGGTVKTLFTLPFTATALTMAVNNVDLAVVGMTPAGGFLAIVTPTGVVSTLAQFTSYIYENIAVDANGTYVVPIGAGGIKVLRIDSFGTVTTITPSPPAGKGKPRGIAVDINTGGYLVGEIPNLYKIARDGTSTLVHTNIQINNSIDMMSDARTGAAIISQQNSLVGVDVTSGIMTTIQGGFNGCFPGLAYDRRRDAWILAGGCTFTNNNLYRVNRGGGVTTITALAGATDLEVYGSMNVIGAGDPTPGSPLQLRLHEPGSAGYLYLAAAALSTNPGIPTSAGIVDLTPDSLFMLSQLAPAMFVNFQGVLDANGAAVAKVMVPGSPLLKGLRFYISFVTVKGVSIQAIANTRGFTIQ